MHVRTSRVFAETVTYTYIMYHTKTAKLRVQASGEKVEVVAIKWLCAVMLMLINFNNGFVQ